jgi:hypothetical protein
MIGRENGAQTERTWNILRSLPVHLADSQHCSQAPQFSQLAKFAAGARQWTVGGLGCLAARMFGWRHRDRSSGGPAIVATGTVNKEKH